MAKPAPKNAKKNVALQRQNTGRPAGLVTWIAVGVVVLIVGALVIVKISKGGVASPTQGWQATSAETVTALTTVPQSVFDTIGITSPIESVTTPEVHLSEPQLTYTDAKTGTKLPGVYYFGSEYCPFCAAQRWPTIVALARFGTFASLGNTSSSSTDVYPSTPSFTFTKATYSSPYIALHTIEEYSNVPSANGQGYVLLHKPTAEESAIIKKYDTPTYFPTMNAQYAGSIPFFSIGNRIMWAGASISPSAFQGQVRDDIAKNLTDTTNPITQGVIASANYITAAICSQTGQQPGKVCNSKGVLAAKKALKL